MPHSTMATSRNRILWESPKAWRNAISHTSASGAPISFFRCTIRRCSIGIGKDELPELMEGGLLGIGRVAKESRHQNQNHKHKAPVRSDGKMWWPGFRLLPTAAHATTCQLLLLRAL